MRAHFEIFKQKNKVQSKSIVKGSKKFHLILACLTHTCRKRIKKNKGKYRKFMKVFTILQVNNKKNVCAC